MAALLLQVEKTILMKKWPDSAQVVAAFLCSLALSFSLMLNQSCCTAIPPRRSRTSRSALTCASVHGTFNVKRCEINFDPASAAISGEVVFDASAGQTGNGSRDRKMHKDVLESERYPDITFRPDRVDGKVVAATTSTVQVHGMYGIHGASSMRSPFRWK